MRHSSYCIVVLFSFLACGHAHAPAEPLVAGEDSAAQPKSDEFNAYWYAGQAEITTYSLEQARYGEVHPGESVLIFVTEDFNTEKQVKREMTTSDDYTSVLKLNKLDRFVTGIYDYSLMLSTFTPIQSDRYPHCLKTSFSAQDWCGQSMMQMNKTDQGYRAEVRSYFEAEGDAEYELEQAILEDEIWTRARLDPMQLPQGDFAMIPSSAQLRLRHEPVEAIYAKGQLVMETMADASERYVYKVNMEDGRFWQLYIASEFPYRIQGWEMRVQERGRTLTTTATAEKSIKSAYWGQNDTSSRVLRERLGLD
jgi:hypothetical protein